MKDFQPEIVSLDAPDVEMSEILVHDEARKDAALASILASLSAIPDFPHPMGILRRVEEPCYEQLLEEQVQEAKQRLGEGTMASILESNDSWVVSEDQADG